MIDGIGSIQLGSTMNMQRPDYKMTDEDKETFAEIIANYDAESMSSEDMQSLRQDLRQAGIKPGEDLKNLMTEAGFEMTGPPPGMNGMMKPGMNQGGMISSKSSDTSDILSSFVAKFQNGTANEEDLNSLISWINDNSMAYNGNIIDETT